MLVYSAAITRYQSPLRHQRMQHITLRQSIDGGIVEWQFYFTKYKLYIVTTLECRVFIPLFIFPYFCGWRCRIFMIEFSLTEMVLISENITAIAHNAPRISGSENSKLNLVSLQDAGGSSLLWFQKSEFLFFSLFCLNFGLKVWLVHHIAFPHDSLTL